VVADDRPVVGNVQVMRGGAGFQPHVIQGAVRAEGVDGLVERRSALDWNVHAGGGVEHDPRLPTRKLSGKLRADVDAVAGEDARRVVGEAGQGCVE
jgi:hypothetical protein